MALRNKKIVSGGRLEISITLKAIIIPVREEEEKREKKKMKLRKFLLHQD